MNKSIEHSVLHDVSQRRSKELRKAEAKGGRTSTVDEWEGKPISWQEQVHMEVSHHRRSSDPRLMSTLQRWVLLINEPLFALPWNVYHYCLPYCHFSRSCMTSMEVPPESLAIAIR